MKKSTSNFRTIVLASVLSVALLVGVISSLYGYNTQMADAKKSHYQNGSSSSSSGSKETTPDNTPDTTNAVAPSQAQQQSPPSIPGALPAKEAWGGYRCSAFILYSLDKGIINAM
jgi:cytoskeletal protein RodZ